MRMKKSRWLNYFVLKNITLRKGRFIIATSAVALTVAVLTAFVVLSTGIREKMSRELQSYGANMIITNSSGFAVTEDNVKKIASIEHVRGYKGHIYGILSIGGQDVEVIGIKEEDFSGARIDGAFPEGEHEIALGIKLSDALGIKKGQSLKEDKTGITFRVSGVFEKGSREDSAMLMPLETARKVFKIKGFSALLLDVDTRYIDTVRQEIQSAFPALRVTTVRKVAVAQQRLLKKIELLMIVVSAVVVFSAAITLGSTVGANIIERMQEIGLMKALGARASEVGLFFLYEALLSGIVGALSGTLIGVGVAEVVSTTAFNSLVSVKLKWLPLMVVAGVLIAVSATYMPVRRATATKPSHILRGEG